MISLDLSPLGKLHHSIAHTHCLQLLFARSLLSHFVPPLSKAVLAKVIIDVHVAKSRDNFSVLTLHEHSDERGYCLLLGRLDIWLLESQFFLFSCLTVFSFSLNLCGSFSSFQLLNLRVVWVLSPLRMYTLQVISINPM